MAHTFQLVTAAGEPLGRVQLDEDETYDGAIIRRDGEPDRRVSGRIDADDPEQLTILVVERVPLDPQGFEQP